jgi:hypothetical protein
MVSNDASAKQIKELMLDIYTRLFESIPRIEANCTNREVEAYKDAVSKVMGSIVIDVLEPLYEAHPDLKPSNWDY